MTNKIKKNEIDFFHLLRIVDTLFKEHDIDYWLEAGSLIGAVREGTYLKWDKDMDISFHFDDIKRVRELKDEFLDHGITLLDRVTLAVQTSKASMCIFPLHTITKKGKKYLVHYRYPLHWWVDWILKKISPKLNAKIKNNKFHLYICSKIKILRTIRSPLSNLGNLAHIPFCNTICTIPQHVENYLEYMWGDWRTPHVFHTHGEIKQSYDKKIYRRNEKMHKCKYNRQDSSGSDVCNKQGIRVTYYYCIGEGACPLCVESIWRKIK